MIDICPCGDVITKGGTRCDRCDALHVLGLEYGANNDEIKNAFHILAKVWHPDRFESDQKLRTIAEEKLKEFNSAFHLLTMPSSRRVSPDPSHGQPPSRPKPPEPQTEQPEPKPQGQEPRTEGQSAPAAPKQPPSGNRSHQNSTSSQRRPHHSRPTRISAAKAGWGFLGIIAAVILIWVGAYVWHEKSRTRSISSSPAASVAVSPTVQAPPEAQQPHNEVPRSDTPTGPPADKEKRGPKAKGESLQLPASPEKGGREAAPNNPTTEQLVEPRPPVTDGAAYFTVGSTKDDVLAIQGTPTDVSEDEFGYGFSTVYFSHGVVRSWYNSRVSTLKVRLLPSANIARKEYFTVGSTKDDVLAIQGTPTEFFEDEFGYGFSKVYFSHGVVHSWHNSRVNPLKVRLLFSANIARKEYFTVGSTKDDVLAIQGSPTDVSEDEFGYGFSKVYFSHGVVHTWHNSRVNPLKVRLLPSANMARPEYFTVGSTKDDVLAVQGTPTEFSEDKFEYGFSIVYFSHGVVSSWDYSEANPLKVRAPPQ